MKNKIRTILFTILFFSFLSWSGKYSIAEDGYVTALNKGEKAPYSGILLDNVASAKILAFEEENIRKCEANCELKLDLLQLDLTYKIKMLESAAEFDKELHINTIKSYEEQMLLIKDYKVESDEVLWYFIGTGTGVVVTSIIFAILWSSYD